MSDGAPARDDSDLGQRFPSHPWELREVGLDHRALAQSESLFALSNGHIGVRGNLDEGDPNGLSGTYLNSFYETRPLPYAEPGYGYPETGQTILNVTNGKLIRLLVDDEPFDLRYGNVVSHERVLDLRRGVLERHVEWESPAGTRIRVHSSRLVSLARRSLLAIRYRVEPVDRPVRIVVQSELVANEPLPAMSDDPRASAAVKDALRPVLHDAHERRAHLVHRTRESGLHVAAAMAHEIDDGHDRREEIIAAPDWARLTIASTLEPDETFELTKFVAYGWSAIRSTPTLRDQVDAAVISALKAGWDEVVEEQETDLAEFWRGADVEIDGAPQLQRAVRFGIFHAYQASARAERRCIPAKGLTGPGYDGHAFWDTEMFVLPLLTATAPHAAADALRWRLDTLDAAKERARTLRLARRGVPVAHDLRAGDLRLLARRHRGAAHQRRHRRRRRPLRLVDPRRGVRADRRPADAHRDRPAVVLAGLRRRRRVVPHRRCHRPRRVHRRDRRQRLHQPHGTAEPARGGLGRRPAP